MELSTAEFDTIKFLSMTTDLTFLCRVLVIVVNVVVIVVVVSLFRRTHGSRYLPEIATTLGAFLSTRWRLLRAAGLPNFPEQNVRQFCE